MAKKKKPKFKKHHLRNVAPRAPRAAGKPQEETPMKRLAYTAAGAAGTALAGSFLAHEGWAPKTIATALAAVGGGLAWKGDAPTVRSVGAGVMSAAGSQLALMMMDDREKKSGPVVATAPAQVAKKLANAGELPPGALENALARAQARLALEARESEA
ncbi:MAG: hypothetical protein JO257_15175 [Deltaproteobacteria bacterium]|nr:hypothetical protein [Deltaproteobacteria bacterium]